MSKIGIFMADGCEEIEGLTVVDLLRRAGMEISTISISGTKEVTGSHQITFFADELMKNVNFDELDGIVLPGGMPGTTNLSSCAKVHEIINVFAEKGKLVAAICAAPSVLGEAGLLAGRHATCHPGYEHTLTDAVVSEDSVVVDGNMITSRGMGTAIDFSLAIIAYYETPEVIAKVKKGIVY